MEVIEVEGVKVAQMEVEWLEIMMVVVEMATIVEKKSVEAEVVVMEVEVEMPILSAYRELMLEEHLVLVMLPLLTITQWRNLIQIRKWSLGRPTNLILDEASYSLNVNYCHRLACIFGPHMVAPLWEVGKPLRQRA